MEFHEDKPAKKPSIEALAGGMIGAVKKYVTDALAPIATRLAALEKSAATIESLERRASRHAEHLAKLETRLKALEHK